MSNDNTLKTPTNPQPIDPIDPPSSSDFDDLKLPQNFDELLHAKRVLTAVPLRKPAKHDWVRTHPTWEQRAPVLKLTGERDEFWILKNALVPGVPSDLVVGMMFIPYITRQGAIAMWPLRMPAVGRADAWATPPWISPTRREPSGCRSTAINGSAPTCTSPRRTSWTSRTGERRRGSGCESSRFAAS